MKKFFDSRQRRLVFINTEATKEFWDDQWQDVDLKKSIESGKNDFFVSRITKRYIRPDLSKKILEGGCGKGQYVYSLKRSGYDAYGVDYAEKTVAKINQIMPDLKIGVCDLRKIDFPDNTFDGYWSVGVIEHFYDGYSPITSEMLRVIKPKGYLFLTFPYMSPLRRWKARRGNYPVFSDTDFKKETFYQFALDHERVISDMESLGFSLIKKSPFDGVKGLKDEVSCLRPILQKLYTSRCKPLIAIRLLLTVILSPISSHSILLIFKKNA